MVITEGEVRAARRAYAAGREGWIDKEGRGGVGGEEGRLRETEGGSKRTRTRGGGGEGEKERAASRLLAGELDGPSGRQRRARRRAGVQARQAGRDRGGGAWRPPAVITGATAAFGD